MSGLTFAAGTASAGTATPSQFSRWPICSSAIWAICHHPLGPEHLGLIGQLDVVMVPVDGAYTMQQSAMVDVLKLLKARLILPMHYFSQQTLARFLALIGKSFPVEAGD